ncbi:hypothetical protein ACX80E_09425 [Arthrobacter sp. TMN-49]
MDSTIVTTSKRAALPWREIWKTAITFVAAAAALQLVFFGLLIAAQAVPDKAIVDNLAVAVKNGNYGPSHLPDRMGGASDSFTECVVAGTGLGSVGKNAFDRAVVMPRISNCAVGEKQIQALASGKELDPATVGEYYRYWAGYTVISRPVIATMGLPGMRMVAGGMLALGALLAVWALGRQSSRWAAAAMVAPLFLASNLLSTPSTSFSQAMSVSIIFLGIAITAWSAGKSLKHAVFGVGLSAALFCYADLLTTPAIPWAFSTAIVAWVTFRKTRRLKATLGAGLLTAAIWLIAFAGTWASRWALAALFVGIRTTYKNIKTTMDFRTVGEYKNVDKSLGAPTAVNWNYWIGHVPTSVIVLVVCAAIIVVALAFTWRRNGLRTVAAWPVLAASALVIVLWYEALNNHSQIHAFFTYRGFPAMLGILTFAALALASMPRPDRTVQEDTLEPGQRIQESGSSILGQKPQWKDTER